MYLFNGTNVQHDELIYRAEVSLLLVEDQGRRSRSNIIMTVFYVCSVAFECLEEFLNTLVLMRLFFK